MSDHNLGEWLAWLERLHPSSIDLGLDRRQFVRRHSLVVRKVKAQMIWIYKRPFLLNMSSKNFS